MPWVALVKLLLTFVNALVTYLHDQKLLEAGAAQEAKKELQNALDAIGRARDAIAGISDDPDSVRNDPNNRDNQDKDSKSGGA